MSEVWNVYPQVKLHVSVDVTTLSWFEESQRLEEREKKMQICKDLECFNTPSR